MGLLGSQIRGFSRQGTCVVLLTTVDLGQFCHLLMICWNSAEEIAPDLCPNLGNVSEGGGVSQRSSFPVESPPVPLILFPYGL